MEWPKKIYQWTLHGRRIRGRPQQSWRNQDGLHEKQKHGRRYGRGSLAFGSGWTALGCRDPVLDLTHT